MKKRIVELIIAVIIGFLPAGIIAFFLYLDAKATTVTKPYEPFKPVTVWSMPEDTSMVGIPTVDWVDTLNVSETKK